MDDAPPVVGTTSELTDLIRRQHVDRVVVSMSDRRGRMPIRELLQAKMSGVRVEDAATMYERLTGKILIDEIKPSWLIFSDGFRASRTTRAVKRVVDLMLAAVGLVLAAPLMLLTARAVRLESPGAVLYRQERVGENGRVFTLCKFRSMRTDAENGTPVWAKDGDNRVTRIGRFIRLTRLDELPQLWNVLRGDMSLVGPRPPLRTEVQGYESHVHRRLFIKPGLTGMWQVNGRSDLSWDESVRLDLYYVENWSLTGDVMIMWRTFRVLTRPVGAY